MKYKVNDRVLITTPNYPDPLEAIITDVYESSANDEIPYRAKKSNGVYYWVGDDPSKTEWLIVGLA